MKRGDIFYADLNPVIGNEQGGLRPVLVIQNNMGNKMSPTVIVAAMTSKKERPELPTQVCVKVHGLSRTSVVMLEQIRTIDRCRLRTYVNNVGDYLLQQIDEALAKVSENDIFITQLGKNQVY